MADRSLRILLLEDDVADAELVTAALNRAGLAHVAERVDTEGAFLHALRSFTPNLILSDHSLAQFDALAAIRAVRMHLPSTPFIVVSGAGGEESAVQCLRAGADNYIVKDRLSRLAPAIENALALREPLTRLTPRQLEVLRLLAQGNTTRDIARQLKLSVKTVETHRADMMKRLNIHDVAGLVRLAIRAHLVSSES